MKRRAAILAAFALSATLGFVGAHRWVAGPELELERPTGPVLRYHGRFAGTPELQALQAELPARLEQAKARAAAALGVVDTASIRLRLIDDESGRPWIRRYVARTLAGTLGPSTIELRLEPLLAGRVDLDTTLTHEATHAVMARVLGSAYARVPEWLREGIAVDVAGETLSSVSRAISLTRLRPVEKIANGVMRTREGISDYGEAGLAMQTLRSLSDETAVPRLVACLQGGAFWQPCLRELTGMEPAQFEARALLDALERIGTIAGERVSSFDAARERLAAGDVDGALEMLERLRARGAGPFDREATLESARTLVLLDRPAEALERTAVLMGMGDYGPEMGLELLALEALASRRAGLEPRADRACEHLRLYYAQEGGDRRSECGSV